MRKSADNTPEKARNIPERAQNDGTYHIYDITKRIRATAHRSNGVGSVTPTYSLNGNGISYVKSITDTDGKVNTENEKNLNSSRAAGFHCKQCI